MGALVLFYYYNWNFKVQKIEEESIFEPRKKEDCKGFLRLLSHARPTYKDWKLSLSSIVPVLRPYQVSIWKCFCLVVQTGEGLHYYGWKGKRFRAKQASKGVEDRMLPSYLANLARRFLPFSQLPVLMDLFTALFIS